MGEDVSVVVRLPYLISVCRLCARSRQNVAVATWFYDFAADFCRSRAFGTSSGERSTWLSEKPSFKAGSRILRLRYV